MNEDELAERLESEISPGAPRPVTGSQDDERVAHLRGLLSDEATWLEPAREGADALLAAIQTESGRAEPLAPAPEPVVAPMAAASRRPGRLLALSLAAALVLLAGVAVGALLADWGGDDGPDRPTEELALAGTGLAPGASAAGTYAEWQSGFAITLDITGLPPAEPGTYYQGWVKGPGGLVSIGTFHMRGGDGRVELWSGVDLDRYPTVTVTVQEEGAGPESSGHVVLQGKA